MKVINFFGGPGAGKSSFATGLFSRLKFRDVNCEYVSEFAKDLTWEDRHVALGNQWHVSSTQHHRIHRLEGKVDYVITDSPIILGCMYYEGDNPHFKHAFLHEFRKYDNINYFVDRAKPYKKEGRFHNEEEAKALDLQILTFLRWENIFYKKTWGVEESLDEIVKDILEE